MSQKSQSDDADDEFKLPSHTPQFVLRKPEFFLSLFIVCIPVLALWGVFGETMEEFKSTQGPIEVTIEYPRKIRLKQRLFLSVTIKNISKEYIEDLQVSFDKKYLDKFSDVSATPSFDSIYKIHLGSLPPAETAEVNVEFQGQKYGRHDGSILIQSKGERLRTLQVSSTIFP